MNIRDVLQKIENNAFFKTFEKLYGTAEEVQRYQKQRYLNAVQKFAELYPKRKAIRIYSAPGRTEIGGNHTDHQHGCVLAAAVNMDAIAVVGFHRDGVIRVKSEGYDAFTVNLDDLSVQSGEKGTAAIIRGIAAKFSSLGAEVGGFDLYCTSDVLSGSGISSSAAFETLIGTIIDSYYNDNKAGAVEIAKIGQFAENVYFGKKSGLMDQMVSSVGGLVSIDFYDTQNPEIERFDFDFEAHGYCLCITDTKGSHENLTDDYVAIRSEMESIPLILQVPNGKRETICIYGTDYDTPDGTCIRDYIHVTDLAQAHILAVQYLMNGGESDIFNLGNGVGYSVRQVIETARKVTGHSILHRRGRTRNPTLTG